MRNPFRSNHAAWGAEPEAEQRALGPGGSGLAGYNITDPSAIPPPGMGAISRNWAGVNISEKTVLQSDAVMTSLRIISNGIIELGDPMAYTNALDDSNWPYRKWLAQQPQILTNTFGMAKTGNIAQPQYIGTDQTIFSMGLWGEAWWYVLDRDRNGPTAVEVLLPPILVDKADNDGKVTWWYGIGSDQHQLDPDNLIHIPNKSLPASRRGLSALDYAGINVAISLAALDYGARWFSQGISSSYVLVAPGKLGKDEAERVLQTMLIQHAGLSQAHLPIVIDSGLEPKKVSTTPDENQYLQTLEYCRSVIAAYFGIPASLLGNALQRLAPQPAHTIGEEMQRMMSWTLSSYVNALEQIYSGILPTGQKVAYDRSRILQSDAQSFAMLLMNVRNTNSMSINEVRTRYLGLAPVEGGDEVVAPLASNVSGEQTDNPIGGDDQPESLTDKSLVGSGSVGSE